MAHAPARLAGHRADAVPPASPHRGAEPARGQRDGARSMQRVGAMPFRQPATSSGADELTSAGRRP
jgi:hypothetical protein